MGGSGAGRGDQLCCASEAGAWSCGSDGGRGRAGVQLCQAQRVCSSLLREAPSLLLASGAFRLLLETSPLCTRRSRQLWQLPPCSPGLTGSSEPLPSGRGRSGVSCDSPLQHGAGPSQRKLPWGLLSSSTVQRIRPLSSPPRWPGCRRGTLRGRSVNPVSPGAGSPLPALIHLLGPDELAACATLTV